MSTRPDPTPFSLEDAARGIARNNGLIDASGQLHCWNCSIPIPWHVSLHCDPCRHAAIERNAAKRKAEAAEHPETKRWRAIHRDMLEDRRLNRASALSLIKNCEKLRSATDERMAELRRLFEQRFGMPQQQQPPSWTGKGFRK